jgi:hypothetical protein
MEISTRQCIDARPLSFERKQYQFPGAGVIVIDIYIFGHCNAHQKGKDRIKHTISMPFIGGQRKLVRKTRTANDGRKYHAWI